MGYSELRLEPGGATGGGSSGEESESTWQGNIFS